MTKCIGLVFLEHGVYNGFRGFATDFQGLYSLTPGLLWGLRESSLCLQTLTTSQTKWSGRPSETEEFDAEAK